jgi:hypothetical protein
LPVTSTAIWSRTTRRTEINPLWHAEMGAVLSNAAETYLLDGHQYVLAAAGDTVYGFRLP